MKKKKVVKQFENRVVEIDLMRGIAVLLMIFDHFMYDLSSLLPYIFSDFPHSSGLSAHIYSIAATYWMSGARIYIRYIVIFVFLALTGICCSFSKNNLKRGLKLLGVAYTLTFFTYIFGKIINDPDIMISFGILHCIGFALVIVGLMEKKIHNKWPYLIIGLIGFGLGTYFELTYELESYVGNNFFLLTLKQMIGLSYCGGDCFPLIFNGGQVLIGVFLGKLLYSTKQSFLELPYYNNPVTFIGRNSLGVYLLHQIILPIITGLILLICGFHISI